MSAMNYLFRKPHFPIIVNTGTGLIGIHERHFRGKKRVATAGDEE